MIIWIPALVGLVGLLIYALCNAPNAAKPSEIGRLMFFAGLLVTLFILGTAHPFHVP